MCLCLTLLLLLPTSHFQPTNDWPASPSVEWQHDENYMLLETTDKNESFTVWAFFGTTSTPLLQTGKSSCFICHSQPCLSFSTVSAFFCSLKFQSFLVLLSYHKLVCEILKILVSFILFWVYFRVSFLFFLNAAYFSDY